MWDLGGRGTAGLARIVAWQGLWPGKACGLARIVAWHLVCSHAEQCWDGVQAQGARTKEALATRSSQPPMLATL